MAGCSSETSWTAATVILTSTALSCTTRPAGTWTATGTMVRVRGRPGRGAARRQGPGAWRDGAQVYDPASGTWTATGKRNDQRLRWGGHPAVRRQGARGGRLRLHAGEDHCVRTRPRSTTPSRGPGPRSRTCTRRRDHGGAAAARWQGAGGRSRPTDPWRSMTRPPEPGPHSLSRPGPDVPAALLSDGTVLMTIANVRGARRPVRPARTTRGPCDRPPRACSGAATAPSFTLLLDGTVLVAGGSDCNGDGSVRFDGRGGAVRPCRRAPAAVASLPEPAPACLPEPDPGPDAAPAGGRSRSAERSELDRHGRQRELRARDAVRGRGGEAGYGSSGRRPRTWSQPAPP